MRSYEYYNNTRAFRKILTDSDLLVQAYEIITIDGEDYPNFRKYIRRYLAKCDIVDFI
ncbi:hypothetical protein INO08_16675 [Staphylococcus aureus]|nr:hypothetical protein [Staphylococcus aureus]